jgi:energy-coupling factor transport system substrate-specific component
MSWELASFLILGAVLLAGFAWYERSQPPSQVVALVAALAALAVAGRIAFAALPNVKPTTDIVIFAGYALGGAPGFAVGALAALVSNFWFGQGPWTPWQMAGWGLCGVLGAALALGTRNAGRLTLAATCGFAGILYGALLNFSLMATYGGDLTWQRFGVLEARAIPFDAAHVAGNVALALLAGPAMVRMLVRFRQRFAWCRPRAGAAVGSGGRPGPGRALRGGGIAALLLAVLFLGAVAAPPAHASSVSRAADWLESTQNSDGGFGPSAGDGSRTETTCWVMLGLAAAGRNPLDVADGGRTPVDFLRGHIGALRSPGDLARTILALEAAGVDPRSFGGRNLVSDLLASRRDDGSYNGWPNSTAFAVIALRAAGAGGGLAKSLDWLRRVQNDDGGWGDTPRSPSTTDGTGAVLQALSPDSKASSQGVEYLQHAQHLGGGFPLGASGTINTQSTAWAIQGLLAAGRDPNSFKRGGVSAPGYLANNQREDGSYRYAKATAATPSEVADQTPVFVTGEVLVAAAGKFFPITAPARAPQPAPSPSAGFKGSGGLPSSNSAPPASSEGLPELPSASSGSGSGGGIGGGGGAKPLPLPQAPSGKGSTGTLPLVPEGSFGEGKGDGSGSSLASPPEASGEQASETTDSGSTAGAIVLGLLAGCLLFLLGLGARRGWMHWRYGL